MTEEEACLVYATAWNRLSPEFLIEMLDDDVRYSSQSVLTDMNGKEVVSDYLRGKMDTIRRFPEDKAFAELAETQPYDMYPNPPIPCVVLSQGNPDNLVATVLFRVSETGIKVIEICIIPPPHTTKRTGIFPK